MIRMLILDYVMCVYLTLLIRAKEKDLKHIALSLFEATIGFEPMMRVLQTRALPLGYVAL